MNRPLGLSSPVRSASATTRSEIAATIKRAMAEKGLTNRAIERATGISQHVVSHWRSGVSIPSEAYAVKLEQYLCLTPGRLQCAETYRGRSTGPKKPVRQEPEKSVAKIADGYGCPKITPKAHGPVCLLTLIRCPLNTPEQRANCARLGKLAKPVDLDDGAGVYFAGYGPRR